LLLFLICFFFLNNVVGHRLLRFVDELLPQDIASAFVGRFRWGLHRFLGEEKHFPAYRTVLKIVARWRYDCARMAEKMKI